MSPLLTWAIMLTLGLYAASSTVALLRLLLGPTILDRILALDYLYLHGLLMTLVLGILYNTTVSFEIALLIAIFGFVSSSALTKFVLRGEVIE